MLGFCLPMGFLLHFQIVRNFVFGGTILSASKLAYCSTCSGKDIFQVLFDVGGKRQQAGCSADFVPQRPQFVEKSGPCAHQFLESKCLLLLLAIVEHLVELSNTSIDMSINLIMKVKWINIFSQNNIKNIHMLIIIFTVCKRKKCTYVSFETQYHLYLVSINF